MLEEEVDLEQCEIEKRENTKLRIPEWIRGLSADYKETQSNQQVVISAGNYAKEKTRCLDGQQQINRYTYHQIT